MKSYRLFLFERSCVLTFCAAFVLASAAGVFGFVEHPVVMDGQFGAMPQTVNGEWTASLSSKDAGRIQMNFSRRTERGGFNQMGNSMKLSDLQGLPAEIASPGRMEVNFRLTRDAGTVTCEGYFQDGRGAGLWTFTPNGAFASAMASRGFANLTDEDLLRATFHNLTVQYADQIKAAGYDQITFAQLSRAAVHDISVDYIRDLRNSGFENLTMENIIRASNHDINAAYVKEVAAMGFGNQPLDKVIRLKNHDISPAYISELKAAGFENLTLDEVVRMKNHDVSVAFVNDVKAEGFSNITASTIIRLKNHDVDRAFIQRARAQYPNASLEEMVRLKNNGTVR